MMHKLRHLDLLPMLDFVWLFRIGFCSRLLRITNFVAVIMAVDPQPASADGGRLNEMLNGKGDANKLFWNEAVFVSFKFAC